ncbi:hypothetical protein MMC18_000419 [Xylographa bjoerkii]|nr:hypothetical protein [Xylographa bjoerkii]
MPEHPELPIKLTAHLRPNALPKLLLVGMNRDHQSVLIVAMTHLKMTSYELAHCTMIECLDDITVKDVSSIQIFLQAHYDIVANPNNEAHELFRLWSAPLSPDVLASWHLEIKDFLDDNYVEHACQYCAPDKPRPDCPTPSEQVFIENKPVDRITIADSVSPSIDVQYAEFESRSASS